VSQTFKLKQRFIKGFWVEISSVTFPEIGNTMAKKIYDDKFCWEGWGGRLRLGSGVCWLWIYDLAKQSDGNALAHLKPIIVVASDIDESSMSIRSCAAHIATQITESFNISPHRMLYVEYCPPKQYGEHDEHLISEIFDSVEFTWQEKKAINPQWRPLQPPLRNMIRKLIHYKI